MTFLSCKSPTAAEASSRKTLSALALAVAKARRIVVVTGAGISCSSGIPDFRSSDGLYNLVKSRYPDAVLKGRDLFDAALFRDPTSSALFYTFMAELKTQIDSAHPAPVHDFLATLDAKGKLLRSYTQNIDGLEERAGLGTGECNPVGAAAPRPKNVQLHGDIHRVRCTLCSASFPCAPDHIEQFRAGTPPDCPECTARSDARTARSARALKCGTLRPAIVLYDEPHPLGDQIGAVQTSDLGKKPDLLIIMGTSLKVHGLRRLVKSFAKAVHTSRPTSTTTTNTTSRSLLYNVVFVNRTPPPPEWTGILDYHVQGDTDTWVAQVLSEWRRARPADWEVQATLEQTGVSRGIKGLGLGEPGKGKGVKGKLVEDGKAGKKGKDAAAVQPKGKAPNLVD
ncbi:DHS-like NAD/FAD-binding domain-containing protein [Ceratobasidium sp. AG-I]|nr:DHS-like NAD/FAD-binding domain-containing protein [Ceratobasidium sp. AG-I]